MTSRTRVGASAPGAKRRWLVEIVGGDLRLAEDEAGLRDLAARGLLTHESRIYEVVAGPHRTSDIPALAQLFADAEVTGPVTRASLQSLERARLSEELAILNRPLEDEEPFYEESPRSRFKPFAALLLFLALGGGAGYFKLRYRPTSDIVATAGTSNADPARTALSAPADQARSAGGPDVANVRDGQLRARQRAGRRPSDR